MRPGRCVEWRLCLPALALAALSLVCGPERPPLPPEESVTVPGEGTVVVYVEAARRTAGPVLKLFEEQSGVKVSARYRETLGESFPSVLKAEAEAGRADVFWAATPLAAIELAREGLAVPFRPAGARPVPGQYRDPRYLWIGFAVNPRVIIYNNERLKREEAPTSTLDLVRPPWAGKGAVASIRQGSAAFHAAALFSLWGRERARAFFEELRASGSQIVEDDTAVRRLVATGEALWGVIDLDEAICAKRESDPIHIFFPDRLSLGAVVPPQVAVLLRGAPNPAQAKGLFAYLFSTEAAWQLGRNDCALITLLPGIPKPDWVPALGAFNVTQLDNQALFDAYRDQASYFQTWGRSSGTLARAPER
jgi:iron(III) transport system substrate-binding protein